MADSQPPEGLRKIAREAAALPPCRHWLDVGETKTCVGCIADAVLAALFDACEVREEWGVRSGEYDLFSSYTRKEVERVIAEEAADGNESCQMIRRCVLSTPAEPVSSTGEEGFHEPDEPVADVQAAFEAGEKGVTKRRVSATAIRGALYDSLSPNFEIDSDGYDDAAVAVALLVEGQERSEEQR